MQPRHKPLNICLYKEIKKVAATKRGNILCAVIAVPTLVNSPVGAVRAMTFIITAILTVISTTTTIQKKYLKNWKCEYGKILRCFYMNIYCNESMNKWMCGQMCGRGVCINKYI